MTGQILSAEQQKALLGLMQEGMIEIYMNANDVFAPAADSVDVETIERLRDYLDSYTLGGYNECVNLMKKLSENSSANE